jgi:8-oxo-(d)GTP phosphatase
VIFLVRHAHAGTRPAWAGADADRPLSPQGYREAEALVALLADRAVTRVLSSPRERCLATVAPLAAARGLPVECDPRLDEAAVPGEARALLEAATPGTVLCTHRPVITDLLEGVVARGAHLGHTSAAAAHGSVWELAVAGGRILSGSYLPPVG